MYRILKFNQISLKGLELFSRDKYEIASEFEHPDAILLRSHALTESDLYPSVRAIARAGAGVNNVPVPVCTERGIVVFNTPGANANAVKELVLTSLLLASRGILEGVQYVKGLDSQQDTQSLNATLEKEKKRFRGNELQGKTLGVIGLGAIGSLVADIALTLGMNVLGYDPALSIDAAWRLPREITRIENLHSLLSKSDYITLHLPVLESTRHLINKDTLKSIKPNARLLNFSRDQIVNGEDVIEALAKGKLSQYITDFPEPNLIGREDVILMPHIGASTLEAEENCAIMAANQLMDFLENGNIKNSVNFPAITLERTSLYRITLTNKNVPKILGKVLSLLADHDLNIVDMINKSRQNIAYNLIDTDTKPSEELLDILEKTENVINVRVL